MGRNWKYEYILGYFKKIAVNLLKFVSLKIFHKVKLKILKYI